MNPGGSCLTPMNDVKEVIRIVTVNIGPCSLGSRLDILDVDSDLVFVGHSTDVRTALELCAALHPDVILMDFCDAGADDVRTVRAFRATNAQSKVIVLSRSDDPEYVRAMLKVGISGYLLDLADAADLVLSIRTVYSGQVVCSSTITRALFQPGPKR